MNVVLVPADRPAETGFEHGGRLVDVVAVQPHRGFEPQRVAGAEAARDDVGRAARFEQRLPHAVGHVRRHEDLEAVLPGVAGARDDGARVRHLAVTEPVVLELRQLDAGERLQHFAGGRPLNGDERIAAAGVDRRNLTRHLDLLGDPGVVLGDIRRVHHEHEVVRRHPVDQHVVDERTFRGRQRGIVRLPDLQATGVVARDPLHRGERVLAGNLDLAHVADIEQPGPGSDRHVLVGDAGVLDRHVPAGVRHHPRIRGAMPGVQWCLAERGGRIGHHKGGGGGAAVSGDAATVLSVVRGVKAAGRRGDVQHRVPHCRDCAAEPAAADSDAHGVADPGGRARQPHRPRHCPIFAFELHRLNTRPAVPAPRLAAIVTSRVTIHGTSVTRRGDGGGHGRARLSSIE